MTASGHRWALVLPTVALVAALGTPTAAPAGIAKRCAVAKLRAAAKQNAANLRCHWRALVKGTAVDPTCLGAAKAKFLASFRRIEARGGCATVDDAGSVEASVDACVGLLVSALPSNPMTTTTTTSPICATMSTTTTTTTTSMPGGTTTTAPPSAVCSSIGGSCGQCGSGQCVAPIPGIPIGACVEPVALASCPGGQPDCGPDEVCVSEGSGSFHCYALCF
ncbi:MAG: hypothetical protein E6J79_19675 [Deltaproteobacteria bacterium]|nr:MAG: hypothetical protein E6J79_19675 [Deltaproteobacteria bacterium]